MKSPLLGGYDNLPDARNCLGPRVTLRMGGYDNMAWQRS